jgi:hypothetical protein
VSDPKPPAEGADVGKFLREAPSEIKPSRDSSGTARGIGGGRIPARMSFVTFAVGDMPAMTRFYRQFGWPESKFSDESFVAFRTSGAILGLFPAENYEEEFGAVPARGVFKGFVLAINLEDPGRVDAAYETMRRFDGIRILGEPKDLPFGGRGFEFLDPEGNAWEVVWAEGTSFDERGALIFP